MPVYRNKHGYYEVDFKLKGRRLHRCTQARTEAEALAIEKQLRAHLEKDIAQEELTGTAPLTLTQACYRYWEQKGKDLASAADTQRSFLFIIETLGKNTRLDQITDAHLIKLIDKRRKLSRWGRKGGDKTVSNATINRDVTEVLRRLFNYARRVWKCQLPLEPDWRSHILKEPQERVRMLDTDEAVALKDAVRDDFALWYRFSRLTGLRRAETLIEWKHVNWAAKKITVPGKGGRDVVRPITASIAAILEECRGHGHPTSVFTYVAQRTANGKVKGQRYPITYEGAKVQWRRQRERAGVENFRFHDLRHDFASRALRDGGNLKEVMRALGHTSIQTTSRYAHVRDEDVAGLMERLAQSMDEPPKTLPNPTKEVA
jgi:integrase